MPLGERIPSINLKQPARPREGWEEREAQRASPEEAACSSQGPKEGMHSQSEAIPNQEDHQPRVRAETASQRLLSGTEA